MNNKNQPQSVLSWMASERLYEEYLFFYILIIVFWGAVGLFTFGFELSGYSLQQNLLFNFLWFLVLAIAMAFTPFWYHLVFGRNKSRLQRRNEEVQQKIEAIEDPIKREAIKQYLANDGGLAPRTLQKWSLIFLGWCALFELFFISAWVKDLTLIWQPVWIQWTIDWMKQNTVLLSTDGADRKLFSIYLRNSFLKEDYASEQEFLDSALGRVALIFQFWRALSFFPILTALIILLWKPIDWLGMIRLDPRYIQSIGKFLWCSVISFFMFLFLIGGYGLIKSINFLVSMVLSKAMWLNNFYLNAMSILIIFSLKIFVGWFYFWQRIYRNKFN